MKNLNKEAGINFTLGGDAPSICWFASHYLTAERGYTSTTAGKYWYHTDLKSEKGGEKYGFEIKRRFWDSTTFNDNICTEDKINDSRNYDKYFLISFYPDGVAYWNDLKKETAFNIKREKTPKGQTFEEQREMEAIRTNYHFQQYDTQKIQYDVSELYTPEELEKIAIKTKKYIYERTATSTNN